MSAACPQGVAERLGKAVPHDPGVEVARKRAEDSDGAARVPIKVGKGKVRFGTASWTDPTMTAPGVFYPRGADRAEERLRFYASKFSVVEVDSTALVASDPTLPDATPLSFRVRAVKEGKRSAYSNEVSIASIKPFLLDSALPESGIRVVPDAFAADFAFNADIDPASANAAFGALRTRFRSRASACGYRWQRCTTRCASVRAGIDPAVPLSCIHGRSSHARMARPCSR